MVTKIINFNKSMFISRTHTGSTDENFTGVNVVIISDLWHEYKIKGLSDGETLRYNIREFRFLR